MVDGLWSGIDRINVLSYRAPKPFIHISFQLVFAAHKNVLGKCQVQLNDGKLSHALKCSFK